MSPAHRLSRTAAVVVPTVLATATATATVAATPGVATAGTATSAADCGNGYVALTFDDGPNPGTTTALIDTLTRHGVRATFFTLGEKAEQNPTLLRAQQRAGMWTGNHSWSHPRLAQLDTAQITSELSRTQQVVSRATGTAPRLFRPPYGDTSTTVRSVAAGLGLTEVLWSVDSQDWNGASADQIVRAADRLSDGDVLLLHDGYQSTVDAIPRIVASLAEQRLCAGMISPDTGRAVAPEGATARPTASSPPPPTGVGCTAAYRETGRWDDRFNGEVTIRAGSFGIRSWTVTVTVRAPQRIAAVWDGSPGWDNGGLVMTVRPSGNGNLPAGGSTSFGFTVLANGTWTVPTVSCRIP